MTTHASAALRDLVDASSGRAFQLYVRVQSQTHITLAVLMAPASAAQHALRDGSAGGGGSVRWFRGELSALMQPSALSAHVRDNNWASRVIEALIGGHTSTAEAAAAAKEKYTFEVREIAVPVAATGAAATEDASSAASAAASSAKRSRKSTPASAVPSTRGELKILYRKSPLIKFPLSYAAESSSSASASAAGASTAAPASFSSYRVDTLKLLDRVSGLTSELSQRLAQRDAALTAGSAKLAQQLNQIGTKATQKRWMEEGVLAQIHTLLQTKDQEIRRLKEEQKSRQFTPSIALCASGRWITSKQQPHSIFCCAVFHSSVVVQCTRRSARCTCVLS